MKKSLRLLAAFSLAATGLLAVATLPAGAVHHKAKPVPKVRCYELDDDLAAFRTFREDVPLGLVTNQAFGLQGSDLSGDIDNVVPRFGEPGDQRLSIRRSSGRRDHFGLVGVHGWRQGDLQRVPGGRFWRGSHRITDGTLSIGFSDVPMTSTAAGPFRRRD